MPGQLPMPSQQPPQISNNYGGYPNTFFNQGAQPPAQQPNQPSSTYNPYRP
ncbi:hypothetical protein [Legionella beliardensis]|uniref:hypothetical protein n=1 Tax=Legionella beliardensis TaxID=91822 RepID=UPI00135BC2CB|nr:hypothetical protein [Legionella beliardensis]